MAAQVLWHDWFPSIWLDEHQQGSSGPRIFAMPATDPINPNVHPLIYRLERHPRAVAGRGARSRGQERHHLQLHLHQLLAGRDGVERLVAQPDRPAHRSGQRAHRDADRAADGRPGPRAAAAAAAAGGRGTATGPANAPASSKPNAAAPASIPTTRCRRRPTSRRAPNIRARGWAATGPSATSSTTS